MWLDVVSQKTGLNFRNFVLVTFLDFFLYIIGKPNKDIYRPKCPKENVDFGR